MFTSWKDCPTFGLLLFVMLTSQSQGQFVPDSRCLETCRLFQNEPFNNYCPKEGSCDWQCAAQRMNCHGQEQYHCAREYGQQQFFNVCAIPQQCGKGQEPAISFTKNTKNVTCIPCVDKRFYNDIDNRMSSTFPQCLYKKYNHCTKENHKIDCGPERKKQAWDVQTEGDGFCRCDARDGYEPKFKDVLVTEGEYCFDRKVECVKKDCVPGMELSLNYQCIPKCAEGLVRTQLSDICSYPEISSSTLTQGSVLPTSTNRTESVTTSLIPPNRTAGTSPHGVDKYVVAVSVTVSLVSLVGIILIIGYVVYRKRRNFLHEKIVDQSVGSPLLKTSEPQSSRPNITNINITGDYFNVDNQEGTINIKKSSDDKKIELAEETGSGSDENIELADFSCTNVSPPTQFLPTDHGSSTDSLQSCTDVAGMIPSPVILSKEGLNLKPGVQPSDAENTPEIILPNNHEGIKPFYETARPETVVDYGFIDELNIDGGSLSEEEMEELAKDLLNTLNEYLQIFKFLNENNVATIISNLKKIAAKKKVNLDKMLNFLAYTEKPSTRIKEVFKCKKCGMEFNRGKSSGINNCCMYQSISHLLCGDERLQNRLRLCSTLHAVRRYKDYVKQMEAFTERESSPRKRVHQILGAADIPVETHGDKDWKGCLREGIMQIVVQTSESTRDSCEIHIMFLSHALRCKIIQHFEDCSHHEDTEDCPVLEEDTENTSDIPDLHILWNKGCNHLTPLFKI
ncbi:uncharacterized protein LOC127873057 [Dreissena polymorpha]|uniref:Uncharacterized protein n=1 Tax=Dreissena polymorpha TaxID=45954 RepID=A0A9D4KTL1_DREPO|nr:uncharacterized protein LOC127873057 [Dreissena polymorpha]KAH3845388.1 hypothetical protein DPMN_087668 [Dreissena polymorpha]